jgi:hypothetical protein
MRENGGRYARVDAVPQCPNHAGQVQPKPSVRRSIQPIYQGSGDPLLIECGIMAKPTMPPPTTSTRREVLP